MIRDLPLRRYPRPHPRPRRLPRHRRPVPDGSAKFAIVAGTAPLTAGVATTIGMSAGPASSGIALTLATLQAAMTQPVTVACGSFGTASWSGGDWASPFQTWIIGHRMSSWIYRKPVGNDAHVVAWLEVRLWDNGEVEVLPWIENGYLLVPGATSKGATYTFTLGGTVRFSASIDIPHHCSAVLLDGAATSHWLGAARDVIVKHDVAYLNPRVWCRHTPRARRAMCKPLSACQPRSGRCSRATGRPAWVPADTAHRSGSSRNGTHCT